MSFNEGMATNTLEVITNSKVEILENNDNLISSFNDFTEKKFTYRLSFENKKALQDFKNSLDKKENIEKINVILN